VDLDGAFSGRPENFKLIQRICREAGVPVQLGGGIRDGQTAKAYLDAGVSQIDHRDHGFENPAEFQELCASFPGTLGVSLDAVEGRLKTRGWVGDANLTVSEVVPGLEAQGASFHRLHRHLQGRHAFRRELRWTGNTP
jgi:phosphoribosylformimino-5-aminoimidazole carboxamide ribotide isomerase